MRRKLLIALATLATIVLVLLAIVVFYIRSGRLDLLLKDQIIAALDEAGIRAELDKSTLNLSGYTVTLEGLRLFIKKNGKELGEVESITARFSVLSYLKQEVRLTDVQIVHPKFTLERDDRGKLNLDSLLEQPERPEKEKGQVEFLTANFTIEHGEVIFVDRQNSVEAHLTGLAVRLTRDQTDALVEELNHRLELSFNGTGASYQGRKIEKISGALTGHVRQNDAQIEKLELNSDLGRVALSGKIESFKPVKYESSDVRIEAAAEQVARVFSPETKISGPVVISASVSGTGADYHLTGNVESSGLVAEGVRVAGLKVKTSVDGSGAEYNATGELNSGAISGRGFDIGSIHIGSARIKGNGDEFDLTGALRLASLKGGAVRINNLQGAITADQQRVGLSRFTAGVLGGNVSGSVSVGLDGSGSKLDASFNSIDLDQVATLAAAKEVTVRGTASGTASLAFPGFNYKQATGRIAANIDGSVSPAEVEGEGTPAGGEVLLIATGNGFKVERAEIRSGSSVVGATGQIGWNGKGAFDFTFNSTDLSEVQATLDSFGVVSQDFKDEYELALAGEGSFTGHAEIDPSGSSISGRLKLDSIKLHEEDVGSFSGDISYSPSEFRVSNGVIERPDGSRADFEVAGSPDTEDSISLKAKVQNFSLGAIANAAIPRLNDIIGRGTVSGDIDLRGLPGPRSIEGTARVTLSDAEFNTPSPNEDEDTRKVAVSELTGDATFSNSVLSVQNLRLRAADSDIVGKGTFNLDTYEYSLDAGATNVDLSAFAGVISEDATLSGRADIKLVGQGKWGKSEDWSELNLNGTIEGRSVIFNGRDLGDAKLVATTENGLVKVEATGKIADQMRSIAGTIDLRDRKNYPVNALIEFTDEDIAPYISWVAPELSGISGVATGSIRLSGPLQNPDDIQVVASFTKLEVGGSIAEGRRYTITNQGPLEIKGNSQGITVERATFTGEGTSVTIEGSLPREGSGRSSLAVNGEINLRLLSSFTPIVFATGIAEVQASIAGSLESPNLLGVMNLKDVGVRIVDFPISAAHGNGQIRFTSNQALIERFVATTPGGGSISIGGGAALAGLVPDRWRLEVQADQVSGEYPRDTHTVFDADLTLQGNRRLQVLSGNVEVRRAAYTETVTLDELITTGGPFNPEFLEAGPGGSGAPSGLQTLLDLHIVADNTLIIKNNLADAVGTAYLNLRGSLDQPVISGRIILNRGTLEFRTGRWDLVRGLLTIPGRRGAEVIVDYQAEADIRGYHITTNFSGEVSKLQVIVRSDPQLPEADIIALILTGSISADRSQVASTTQTGLGLAQSILSASLSEKLEQGTQRLFGLSRFSIDPLLVGRGNDPTARITIGQRVTRDLTVTYSQNLSSGPAGMEQVVLIEYRLSNRFSVVGYRNERSELGFDMRFRKRF
jgi:translocation and assembly module TamB